MREIVERIDATDLYRYLSSTGILRSVQQEVNRRIGNRYYGHHHHHHTIHYRWFAGVWSSLPGAVKEELLEKSLELSEDSLQSMVAEAKKSLMDKDLFDVRVRMMLHLLPSCGGSSVRVLVVGGNCDFVKVVHVNSVSLL